MLFCPNLIVRSICFFVLGFSNLKVSQSYVWASECVTFERRSKAFTIINVVDAFPTLITGLYYLLISRDWFTIYAINLAVSYCALIIAIFCPESPRWLLYNNRQEEAIDALNYMAKFNGSKVRFPKNTVFQETLQLAGKQSKEEVLISDRRMSFDDVPKHTSTS